MSAGAADRAVTVREDPHRIGRGNLSSHTAAFIGVWVALAAQRDVPFMPAQPGPEVEEIDEDAAR